MKDTAPIAQAPFPAWLLGALFLPTALVVGFASGSSLLLLAASAAALLALILFSAVRLAAHVKLIFLLIAVTFLQRLLGYFKLGEVRGLNVGNFLLLASFAYWFVSGTQRGALYKATPVDFWLLVTVILIPLTSITVTVVFRKLPDYSLAEQIVWYKQWVTPFLYFFLLTQCLEKKRDIRLLFYLILGLVGLAVLEGMPEVLRFTNWREARAEGIVGQANDYAALLATMAPFLFLVLFLYRDRRVARILALLLLACMGVSMLTTYSRAGYIAFAMAFAGSLYIAYKATGRLAVVGPGILLATLCLLPIVAVPQVMESLESRFATETYKRAKRKSYSRYDVTDRYSGGRLEIWRGALRMAEDHPLFGVGFHAFRIELPKYHHLAFENYPHNQFLGALAEGGIIWVTALCVLYWKLWRLLFHNWKVALRQNDRAGQLICGGAFLSFIIMLVTSLSNDFLNPGPKTTIFWVVMAGALRYAALVRVKEGSPAPLSE